MSNSITYYERVGFRCLDHIEQQSSYIYLIGCGIQQCPLNHSWGPQARPQYLLHFVLDGRGFLEINNEKYHLSRGQVFLIPPNTVARYFADNSNPWHYAWISFHGAKAMQYLEQAGFDEHHLIRNTNISPEKFSHLINEMLEANKVSTSNELMRVGKLFTLFSLLIESNATNSSSEFKHYDYSSETYIEHALQFIQLNYNRDILIKDIANYIGINRSYLFNIFKNKLQMSPKEYLLNYRMEKAKHLLCTTSHSIKDISEKVGYKDYMTFSKMFRRIIGYSPSQFRERNNL